MKEIGTFLARISNFDIESLNMLFLILKQAFIISNKGINYVYLSVN